MTVYVIATLDIHDREGYDRYVSRFFSTLKGTGGRLLATDESPTVLEGEWTHTKVNLLSFPDRESCEAWYTSDAYQEIAKDRLAASEATILLVPAFQPGG